MITIIGNVTHHYTPDGTDNHGIDYNNDINNTNGNSDDMIMKITLHRSESTRQQQ